MGQLSFRQRVLVLAVLLVTAIQLITLFPVLGVIKNDVDARVRESVGIGGAVFREFMANRAEQLRTTVSVLVSDFGFKQAVASGETETIRSALINHSGRVGANVAMLLDLEGNVLASSTPQSRPTQLGQLQSLLFGSELSDVTHAVTYLDGVPYQTITVPLRSPVPVAWVVMGFQIDDALASRIENLTGLEVSFVLRSEGQAEVLASTLPFEWHEKALSQLGEQQFDSSRTSLPETPNGEFLSLLRPFLPGSDNVYAVLQLSMFEATASYRNVRTILLLITSLSLVLALSGGFWLARTVTRPVGDLVTAARRMREGVYGEPISVRGGAELAELADGFNTMQEAIAQREERIVYQAHHNSLSGLPNRDLLLQNLRESVAVGEPLVVLSLAIDRFGRIVSSLGHRAGDELIKRVARELQGSLEDGQLLGHVGGNEFLIVLPGFDFDQSRQWAERVGHALHAGIRIQGANLSLQATVGVARFPDHSAGAAELMRRASMARSDASAGREPIAVYRLGREEHYLQQLRIVGDFPQAVRNNELRTCFQPKIDCRTREVVGAEALVRWEHPELGLLMPDEFIDAVEQAGSIGHLSRWVIKEALRHCRAWADEGAHLGIAINLSVDDLLDEYLPYYLLEMMNEQNLDASMITLEVTESAIMYNVSQALTVLECIKDIGFRVSIDDFGTGQSSLAQLKRLPLTELKIDKAFVMNIGDARDEAIIRTTIELAHYLGLNVVGEGVENEEALERLRSLGCEYAQGYHISRPIDAENFCDWVRQWRRREKAGVVSLDRVSAILES